MPTRQEKEAADWVRRLNDTSDWWIVQSCYRYNLEPTAEMIAQIRMEATR